MSGSGKTEWGTVPDEKESKKKKKKKESKETGQLKAPWDPRLNLGPEKKILGGKLE